ncbi:MAG: flagellar motor protein [Gammaproteobacteria bacterium]|nr:flagellar motor protein [Gammaproteobacteria bacterium]
MKQLDLISLAGILIAFSAIIIGFQLEGGQGVLWHSTAAIVVLGGSIGATLLQTPKSALKQALTLLPWVLWPPEYDGDQVTRRVVNWSNLVRRDGVLGLEKLAQKEPDAFTKHALELLVDGHDAVNIRRVMTMELKTRADTNLQAADVFEGMGGYSPTLGILGAVLGLIQVMQHLDNPDLLGAGIATAFVATVYGVGFANLICLPAAQKLRNLIYQQEKIHTVLLDSITAIADGDNPRYIEQRLKAYFNYA